MVQTNRDLLVYRLLNNSFFCDIGGKTLRIANPTRYDKYVASEIYQKWYSIAVSKDIFLESEIQDIAISLDIWGPENEKQLDKLIKELENLKVSLYQSWFKTKNRLTYKVGIEKIKIVIQELENKKHYLSMFCAESVARNAKSLYLNLCEVYTESGELFINPLEAFTDGCDYSNEIEEERHKIIYDDKTIREISRTEPWRGVWNSSEKTSKDLFNCLPAELSIEQQMLLLWSNTYDNIYKHSECPPDEIVEDDDALDGWLIIERRKSEKDRLVKQGEQGISDKILNGQEVYIPVDSPEDAKTVYSMNDTEGSVKLRERMNLIRAKGRVKEAEMPDTQLDLQMQVARATSEGIKARR